MLKLFFTIVGLTASFLTFSANQPETIVVCYPGGSVNAEEANNAMGSMLRVVERAGLWPENSFNSLFSTKTADCRQQLIEKNPKFAIISLGLYLELHDTHTLLPLVQPKINGRASQRYRVMVQKGKYQSLDELKGKTLGGTVLEEQAFVGKIVFADKYDPAHFFVVKNSIQAIRTLRALDKGELDAVILNEQQYDGLASLHLEHPLEAVFTSEEIPLMGVVANGTTTTEQERKRFTEALTGMCDDTEGKKLCELFGVDAFIAVDAALFEPLVKLWSEGK